MKFAGIIPARFASSRLPGKALEIIGDQPMIIHVLNQVKKSMLGSHVYVATDDDRIVQAVEKAGGKAVLTDPELPSGTDRCYAALLQLKESYDFVVNIQGDEPFIDPAEINQLISHCTPETQIGTLIQQLESSEELFDPNVVKVVTSKMGKGLYFSRSPVPHVRNTQKEEWIKLGDFWKHIGMYLYRTDILSEICGLPVGSLEKLESLEQLRWLENDYTIKTTVSTGTKSLGVDTPEDLEIARMRWAEQSGKL